MRKIFSFVICLVLLMISLIAEGESSSNSDTAAPTVRVHLKRLALTDRADLILDGEYTMQSQKTMVHFPAGSQVVLQVRSGTIVLFCKGMSVDIGNYAEFIQNSGTGIRFEQNGNYYPGKIKFTVSGGTLAAVLTISMEEYLLGVVPYEMSDQFPLEALKAQAVCARTYAMAHMNPGSNYDVTDTTNDQVFRGINPKQTRARAAVEETAGVVGGYDGKLATCYYGASNGGQTEIPNHVWGGKEKWEYYDVYDDPYDLENSESVVRRSKISKTGDITNPGLKNSIMNSLSVKLEENGFAMDQDCFRIDSVSSIILGKPKFDEPCRQFTQMTITFSWSGKKNAPQSTSADWQEDNPVQMTDYIPGGRDETVTLDIFPDIIRSLNLSINYTDNEILTVVENSDTFVIESRRYGHGVGMSQRGAQVMADKFGKKFYEILAFYYPGMSLMRAPFGKAPMPTAPEYVAKSPAPAATATPRPTVMPLTIKPEDGQWLASVENVDDGSTLNLRETPDTAGKIIMRLMKHQNVVVLEEMEDGDWALVATDDKTGYVMLKFLQAVSE